MINEAIYGVIAVDTVMKLGMNHPMGPLTLAEFIGPDVCLPILKVHGGLGRFEIPSVSPAPLHGRGRKSGQGFYKY
jgi:3-hydroxybutyryl-CoA dehydrogenase